MKFRQVKNGYLVRLDKGEELIQTLTQFANDRGIESGFLYGLGGVQKATLGYYELEEQEYHFKEFDSLAEIVSLNGNFAKRDNEIFLHLHGAFSGRNLNVVGGHVKSAIVAGTCEIHITTFEDRIERVHDEAVGLDLLDL